MEYVQKAWQHRFWILTGLAVLLPIIGWATAMGGLQDNTETRTTKLTRVFKEVEDLSKGPQPNQIWKVEVDKLASELQTRVNAAWEELYAKQELEQTWPADVKNAMAEFGADHLQVRQIYRSRYRDEVTQTARLAKPAILPFALLRFEDWGDQPPTAEEMRNTQEDIWVERALLKVIRQTNQPAETIDLAPIKSIDNLAIGQQVRDPAPVSVGRGGGTMALGGTTRSGAGPAGRYVEPQAAQFKLMRFQIAVTMDHRRVPDLLTNFGSSPIPIEVTQIAMYKQEGAATADARLASDPMAARVEIYGNVFLFNAPPSRQQPAPTGGAQAAAAPEAGQ